MSIKYSLIKAYIKLANPKSYLKVKNQVELHELLQKAKRQEERYSFPESFFKGLNTYKKILGEDTLYRIKKGDEKKKKLIFYLFGGGFISHPTKFDAKFIKMLIEKTDSEFAICDYKLAMTRKLSEMCKSIHTSYCEVLKEYQPEEIIFMGLSSGASMCLYLWNYLRQKNIKPVYPSKLILLSPSAIVPPTDELIEKMRDLDDRDLIVSLDFMIEIGKYLKESEFPHLSSAVCQDMSDFPPIDIFMGTEEIFYAYLPIFEEKAKKDGFSLEITVGENLPHCYPIMYTLPEAREDVKKLIEIIKN